MTKYSRETIIECLRIIKETCDDEYCRTCPLSEPNGSCLVDSRPSSWEIINPPIEKAWKALKK